MTERWVKAHELPEGTEIWLNMAAARTVKGTKDGTVVEFNEADQVTVREEPEVLMAGLPRT